MYALHKAVYFQEQIIGPGGTWHKNMPNMQGGNKRLDSTNLAEKNKEAFCKTCHGRLYGPKGDWAGHITYHKTCFNAHRAISKLELALLPTRTLQSFASLVMAVNLAPGHHPNSTNSWQSSWRKLQVYISPTIAGRYVFHFASSLKNNFEYAMLFMSFVTRKWRYQVSDFSASIWHNFGNGPLQSKSKASLPSISLCLRCCLAVLQTSISSRPCPPTIDQVGRVYLSSMSEWKLIHEQLQNWLKDSGVHQHRMIIGALLLPANFLLAKVIWLPANIFLVYYLFRVNASIRANSGANMLQKLINSRQVNWIPSPEFQSQIETLSTDVTHRIAKTENHGCRFSNSMEMGSTRRPP
ncbi:hypothetical protein BASA61_010435 [Batrachochytrium salamandrivorans]|nr:hypothetical protein BASA61_010435 [Batrachochytrium salamandrivorans]